ncbi:MAG: hypothetical protein V2A72_04890 [Candidatus Omnitrophota bacterium]
MLVFDKEFFLVYNIKTFYNIMIKNKVMKKLIKLLIILAYLTGNITIANAGRDTLRPISARISLPEEPFIHFSTDHHEFYHWMDEKMNKTKEIKKGQTLILFDFHDDLNSSPYKNERTWVYHALKEGLISKLIWVLPPWEKELDRRFNNNKNKEIILKQAKAENIDVVFCYLDELAMQDMEKEALVSFDFDFFSMDFKHLQPTAENVGVRTDTEIRVVANQIFDTLQKMNIGIAAFDLTKSPDYTHEAQISFIETTLLEQIKKYTEFIKLKNDNYDDITPADLLDYTFAKDRIAVYRNNVPGEPKGQVLMRVCEISELDEKERLAVASSFENWFLKNNIDVVHKTVISLLPSYLRNDFDAIMGLPDSRMLLSFLNESNIYLALGEQEITGKKEIEVEALIITSTSNKNLWVTNIDNNPSRDINYIRFWESNPENRNKANPRFIGAALQLLRYVIYKELDSAKYGILFHIFSDKLAEEGLHGLSLFNKAYHPIYSHEFLYEYISEKSTETLNILKSAAGSGDTGAQEVLNGILAAKKSGELKTDWRKQPSLTAINSAA